MAHLKLRLFPSQACSVLQETRPGPRSAGSWPLWLTREAAAGGHVSVWMGVFFANMKT